MLFRLTGNRQVQASGPTVTAATFWAVYYIPAPLPRSTSCNISRTKDESPFLSNKKSLPSTETPQ